MAVLPTLDNLRAVLQSTFFVPIVYGFISILPLFLSTWENSDRFADRVFTMFRSKENMFDFVVVGGGTAGALVANRLAEHYKVLLLEAGGTPSPFQTIPSLALKFLNHPQTDWSHKTVPQRRACLNSINQQSSWSAGRGLGGTSNINFMSHIRGHPLDYDNWASITGDISWGYSGVLPYFKRSETFSGTSNDPEARGHEGELKVRKPSYVGLSEDWIRAGQELGYPFVDLNGHHEEGFGILQYPIFKGIRQSSYAAFLLPVHKSPRLTVRRYSLVRKVLFRDMNNMAYGVEYMRHGSVETAVATKEVILSAGTLGSTKLLMLSGIGPRGHLEELGIPVRSDLPVGRNLQDHLAVHLGPFFIKEPKSFLFDRDVRPENIIRWLFLGTGPITTTGYQAAASIASSVAKSRGEGNWPDLHLILHGQAIHQGYADAFAYAYGLQEDELMQYYSNAIGRDSFHISVVGSRPTSTGQILLGGSSIEDPLVINPRYLEDNGDSDFKILLEGVKTAMTIAQNTSIFRRLGTEFTTTKLPGCFEPELGTDAYWECYIRRYTLTMHNPVGTVPLGAVVDSTLKVQGTRGLRVIDSSIQPTIVGTGTTAPALMIGEKGVDLILKDHGIPDRETDFYDLVFGRNGFIKKNPILKILQREFDTINPLRALFKPFAAIKNVNGDSDAKERFTRNGRVDNPFLQVISTVFGNGNVNQDGDITASGTNNVDVKLEFGVSNKNLSEAVISKRSSEEINSPVDIISKSQWVLQTASNNSTSSGAKANLSQIYKNLSNSTTAISSKIPDKKTKKGKGGRRYALLQAIMRQQNKTLSAMTNATVTISPLYTIRLSSKPTAVTISSTPASTPVPSTLASTPKSSTPVTTPKSSTPVTTLKSSTPVTTPKSTTPTTVPKSPIPTTTPAVFTPAVTPAATTSFTIPVLSTPATVKANKTVVEVVKFKNVVNIVDNDISVDDVSSKVNNTSVNAPFTNASDIQAVAKPVVAENPTAVNLTPLTNPFRLSSLGEGLFGNSNSNPPPAAPIFTDLVKTLSSLQTLMTSITSTANDILLNATATLAADSREKFPVNQPKDPFSATGNNSNNVFGFLSTFNPNNTGNLFNGSSLPPQNNNPFQFLFGNLSSTPTLGFTLPIANSSSNINSISNNNNNIFSSWLKPATSDTNPLSSWLKPSTNPNPLSSWLQPSSDTNPLSSILKPTSETKPAASWFKPLDNSQPTSSWFKPFSTDQKTSSWFQPFNFQPVATTTTTTQAPPNLLELLIGDLKKDERVSVAKTLEVMFPGVKPMDLEEELTNSQREQNPTSNNAANSMLKNSLDSLLNFNNLNPTTTGKPLDILGNLLNAFNPPTTTKRPSSFLDVLLGG